MNPATNFFASRAAIRADFLTKEKLTASNLIPIGADGASRRYFRVSRGGTTAVLMESIPPGHAFMTPGHDLNDFVRIAAWLRAQDLHAPEIYAADVENGYVLLEDFGDTSFKAALNKGANAQKMYGLAVDILRRLRMADPGGLTVRDYNDSHIPLRRRRVVDWYMPAVLQRKNSDGLVEDYLAVWERIERSLPPCPRGFLYVDYHVENLMWLPHEKDLATCGLLDFQGALFGPRPFDLANLLEDARHSIPDDLRAAMLDRFCADLPLAEVPSFRAWYRILATDFHCSVIGQFIRLSLRDGKAQYLQYIPRLAGYLERGLSDPLLKPLADWFAAQGIDFATIPQIDPAQAAKFIRPDAF